MTNAEAIKVLLNEWKCIDRNDGVNCDRKCESCDLVIDVAVLKDAYNMAIKALKEQEWIPSKERSPKKDGSYLISGKWASGKEAVGECEYSRHDGYFRTSWNFDVIAWKSLPEPYRESKE